MRQLHTQTCGRNLKEKKTDSHESLLGFLHSFKEPLEEDKNQKRSLDQFAPQCWMFTNCLDNNTKYLVIAAKNILSSLNICFVIVVVPCQFPLFSLTVAAL